MPNFFSAKTPLKRVLIIKLRHHGDVLLTSPVFTVLKKNFFNVKIDALVYDDTKEMLTNHPYINRIHTIGRNWRDQSYFIQFRLYFALLKDLKRCQYNVLVNLTEHWHGAHLARFLKRCVSVGFKLDKYKYSTLAYRYWISSFTILYPAIQDNTRHMVEVNLDALRCLGIHPKNEDDKRILFIPGQIAEESITEKLAVLGLKSKTYILVHPTSRWMFKALNVYKLAVIVDNLCSRGFPIVLSAAPSKEEMIYMNILRDVLNNPVHDLSGQLTLKELGALVKHARIYFGVDSMPMHIASAVGTPTVAVFGPTGAIKWAPWKVHYRTITSNFTCQPCGKAGCGDSGISDCINAVTSQQILSAIDTILLESSI